MGTGFFVFKKNPGKSLLSTYEMKIMCAPPGEQAENKFFKPCETS